MYPLLHTKTTSVQQRCRTHTRAIKKYLWATNKITEEAKVVTVVVVSVDG